MQRRWQRLVSISSESSVIRQQTAASIITHSKSGQIQLAKMLAVVAIPVIALIIVCSLQLSSAIQTYNAAEIATRAFREFLRLDKLVTGMQLERGMSAAWISSRGTNIDAKVTLTSLWAKNDDAIHSLTRWPPNGLRAADETFHTVQELIFYINNIRSVIINTEVSFTKEIEQYTAITNALMSWSLSVIVLSNMSTIWSMIVSNAALLLASDVIGIQRALGSVFYTCIDDFTVNETEWFFYNEGSSNALLSFASSLNEDLRLLYTQRFIDSDLENNITSLKNIVGGEMETAFSCRDFDVTQRFGNVEFWKVGYKNYCTKPKFIR